jgi:hypothetical protein
MLLSGICVLTPQEHELSCVLNKLNTIQLRHTGEWTYSCYVWKYWCILDIKYYLSGQLNAEATFFEGK